MFSILGKEFNPSALFPAAGLIALSEMSLRIGEDNKTASSLSHKLSTIRNLSIDVKSV